MTRSSLLKQAAAALLVFPLLAACGSPEAPPPASGNQAGNAPSTFNSGGATPPSSQTAVSPTSGLSGTSWVLAELTTAEGSVEAPADPLLYQLTFGADGTLSVTADCNQGSGLWVSTARGRLTVGGMISTLAACPEGSLSSELIAGLESMTAYDFIGEQLRLSQAGNPPVFLLNPVAQ